MIGGYEPDTMGRRLGLSVNETVEVYHSSHFDAFSRQRLLADMWIYE